MSRRFVIFDADGWLFARPAHRSVLAEQQRDGYGRPVEAAEVVRVNLPRRRRLSAGSVLRAVLRVVG